MTIAKAIIPLLPDILSVQGFNLKQVISVLVFC